MRQIRHVIIDLFFTMNSSTSLNPLQLWLDAVNAHNIADILSLYAPDAVLVPTFSAMSLTTPEGIRGYFENLATSLAPTVSRAAVSATKPRK